MRPSWNHLPTSFLAIVMLYSFQFAQIVTRNNPEAAVSLPRELALTDYIHSFNYPEHKYCFIHVGKTAGSKISCELGYSYAPECKKHHALSNITTSLLQRHRGGVRHMGYKLDCTPETNDNHVFIITLRHPLDRLISWYHYEHLRNARIRQNPRVKRGISCLNKFHKYRNNKGCFASLEEFAINATMPNGNDTCQRLAWDVASGTMPCMWHNQMGFRYYLDIINNVAKSFRNVHLLVIRTEHLQQDWISIETLFGSTVHVSNHSALDLTTIVNKSKRKVNNGISKEGTRNLCRALCDEIQVYKQLLLRAENLSHKQKRESMHELLNTCQEESLTFRSCEIDYD